MNPENSVNRIYKMFTDLFGGGKYFYKILINFRPGGNKKVNKKVKKK